MLPKPIFIVVVAQQQASPYVPGETFLGQHNSNLKCQINVITMQSRKELENIGKKSEEKDEGSELTQPTIKVVEE